MVKSNLDISTVLYVNILMHGMPFSTGDVVINSHKQSDHKLERGQYYDDQPAD